MDSNIEFDCIKRSDALFELYRDASANDPMNIISYRVNLCERIKKINSILPSERNGHWIDENPASIMDPRMRCSVCGHVDIPLVKWRFCPLCGANMKNNE